MNAMPPKTTASAHGAIDDGPVKSFQTGQVVSMSICHFIHDVYSSFLAPLLPLLIKKLSLSLTEAGFLTTVMQVPALLNPYLGTLADRISVRYFIILAPGITAVSMSLIGMAPSYGVLLILLLIAGVSVAIFHVPAPVMVARLSGSKKGRGMSFCMTGGELARSLGLDPARWEHNVERTLVLLERKTTSCSCRFMLLLVRKFSCHFDSLMERKCHQKLCKS